MPVLDRERLRFEMARRGLQGRELARMAHPDANTISRALGGKPVTVRTLQRITSALLTQPPLRLASEIVARPAAGSHPSDPLDGRPG